MKGGEEEKLFFFRSRLIRAAQRDDLDEVKSLLQAREFCLVTSFPSNFLRDSSYPFMSCSNMNWGRGRSLLEERPKKLEKENCPTKRQIDRVTDGPTVASSLTKRNSHTLLSFPPSTFVIPLDLIPPQPASTFILVFCLRVARFN